MDGRHLTKEQQQHSPAKRSQSDAVNRNITIQKIITRYRWQIAQHLAAFRQEETQSIA